MQVSIRKFEKTDIPNKVKWINDPQNNTYLHYDLPLEFEKTERWFDVNKDRIDRYDAVILCDEIPVGLIGLLSILDGKAEYYITMGEMEYKGKGIAKRASLQLVDFAKETLKLRMIELYTEVDNVGAQRLFERIGFIKQGLAKASAMNRGKSVDRFYYILEL